MSSENSKKIKKKKLVKTCEQRRNIVDGVIQRFSDLGVTAEMLPQKFLDEMNDYKKEDCPCGFSGKIYVPEIKRYLQYVLPLSYHAIEMVKFVSA